MTKIRLSIAAFAACAALAYGPAACADSSSTHDSNTLHKWGNAVQYVARKDSSNVSKTVHKSTDHKSVTHIGNAAQYPVRKAGQNLSIDTHNVEGKKSVARDPNGSDKVIPPLPHNKRKHLFQ